MSGVLTGLGAAIVTEGLGRLAEVVSNREDNRVRGTFER